MITAAERRPVAPEPVRRRTLLAAIVGTVVAVTSVGIAWNSGFPQQRVARDLVRHWLVHRPSGMLALADPDSGRILLKVDSDRPASTLTTAQGPSGSVLIDETRAEVVTIDEQNVRLGRSRSVPVLGSTDEPWSFGVTDPGLVAISLRAGSGAVIPPDGPSRDFSLPTTTGQAVIAANGGIWSLDTADGSTTVIDDSARRLRLSESADAAITTAGRDVVVLDRGEGELHWLPGDGRRDLASEFDTVDAVLQEPGTGAPCVWIGAGDELICVARSGPARRVRLDGFQFGRGDRLAVTTGVAVALTPGGTVFRLDLGSGAVTRVPFSWSSATPDDRLLGAFGSAIWIDDSSGESAVVVTDDRTTSFDKLDQRAPTFGATGVPLDVGGVATLGPPGTGSASAPSTSDRLTGPRRPDNDGRAEPPVAADDALSAVAGEPMLISLTANDFDPDGDPIAITRTSEPSAGSARIVAPGVVEYLAPAGFSGRDRFTYVIEDPDGQSDQAGVTVDVLGADAPNSAPIAYTDSFDTAAGVPIEMDVLANDVDPEGRPLMLGPIDPIDPEIGTVTTRLRDGRPTIVLTPAPAAAGSVVRLVYRAVDIEGRVSLPAEVTLGVAALGAANRPPLAVADAASGRAGRSVRVPVLVNDVDPDNDPLRVSAVTTPPGFGSVAVDGGVLIVTPSESAAGIHLLGYTVTDSHGLVSPTSVLIRVIDGRVANAAPVLRPDLSVSDGGVVTINPVANDLDPDGDPLTLVDFRQPAGGSLQATADGRLRFTPRPDFAGVTTIAYDVSDGNGHQATSTISINVDRTAPPSAPVAADDEWTAVVGRTVLIPVLANDSDPSGSRLRLSGAPTCPRATCSLAANDRISYTPNVSGEQTMNYTVRNAAGLTASATVRIRVSAADAPPIDLGPQATDDQTRVVAGQSVVIRVLDNDLPFDGDPLEIADFTQPPAGTGVVSQLSATTLEFTADQDAPGSSVTFRYTVRDPANNRSSARVTVTVVARSTTPEPPDAFDDAVTVAPGESVTVDVLENDFDPDGNPADLQLTVLSASRSTAVPGRQRGTIVVGPAEAGAPIRVRYLVTDADGLTDTATLTVTVVAATNTEPIAADDRYTTTAGTAVTMAVTDNDTDREGGPLTVQVVAAPPDTAGRVDAPDSRTLRFTPAAGFTGEATFTYVSIDPAGARSRPAIVTVAVGACPTPTPIAGDRPNEFTPFNTPLSLVLLSGDQTANTLTLGPATGGTVRGTGQVGQAVFTPTAGNNGGGSFTYTVQNSCGESKTGLVQIDVNRPPTMRNIERSTPRGTAIAVGVDEQAADNEPVSYLSATTTAGSVDVVDGGRRIVFNPSAGLSGSAIVTATVADPGGLTASGTITIKVSAPANLAPIANRDQFATEPGTLNEFNVLANDLDPDGAQGDLRLEIVDGDLDIGDVDAPTRVADDGRTMIVEVPAEAHGRGTVRYRAVDAAGARSEITTVTVVVNTRPRGITSAITVPKGGSTRLRPFEWSTPPSDPDGDPLVIIGVGSDSGDIDVKLLDDYTILVEIDGDAPDQGEVTFTVVDPWGGRARSTITVTTTAPNG